MRQLLTDRMSTETLNECRYQRKSFGRIKWEKFCVWVSLYQNLCLLTVDFGSFAHLSTVWDIFEICLNLLIYFYGENIREFRAHAFLLQKSICSLFNWIAEWQLRYIIVNSSVVRHRVSWVQNTAQCSDNTGWFGCYLNNICLFPDVQYMHTPDKDN